MANEKDSNLDAILSELNQNIKKEVSKSVKTAEKPEKVTTNQEQNNEKENKNKNQELVIEKTIKQTQTTTKKNKNTKKKQNTNKSLNNNQNNKKNDFISQSKIFENSSKEDDKAKNKTVKYVEVTSSEQVEETIKDNDVKIDVNDDVINLKVQQNSSDKKISDEISRDNNPHIKKMRAKKMKHKRTKRQKNTAILGAIITLFCIVGVISSIFFIVDMSDEVINNSSKKKELAKEIFPLVIVDIPEFEKPTSLDNSAIISSSIWSFIINEDDKSKYSKDDLGIIYVPAVDIEHYIRRLYGNDIKIKHQTVDESSVMMNYDQENKMYSIESTPKFLPYKPKVDKISKSNDIYTLTVSYILPDAMWNFNDENKVERVDKTMEYVLKKNKNSYQVLSVKLISVAGAKELQNNKNLKNQDPLLKDNQAISEPIPNKDQEVIPEVDGEQKLDDKNVENKDTKEQKAS